MPTTITPPSPDSIEKSAVSEAKSMEKAGEDKVQELVEKNG